MSRDQVQLLGADLDQDQTSYVDCPWCGKIGKMGVTRNREGLLYNCFSAQCNAKGFVPDYPDEERRTRTPIPRYRRWVGKNYPADPQDYNYFWERFEIDLGEWEIRSTGGDEYLFPIRTRVGHRVGEVIRQPIWDGQPESPRKGRPGQPKARTFLDENVPRLSWHVADNRIITLTEDQVSAEKVRQVTGYTAVALLGNTLGAREAHCIAAARAEQVFIFLDPDMNRQAFTLNAEWGQTLAPLSRVIFAERDPKDLSPTEIELGIFD